MIGFERDIRDKGNKKFIRQVPKIIETNVNPTKKQYYMFTIYSVAMFLLGCIIMLVIL